MKVEFTSTRDRSIREVFATAVLSGQPEDGGLYIPTVIPSLPDPGPDQDNSVADLARAILPDWIGSAMADELDMDSIFPFPIHEQKLDGKGDFGGLHVVELFHGPTGSFKDFGARFLAACLTNIRGARDRPAVVVVATSGDTGSAVADAFAGRSGIGVAILFPDEGVSAVQKSQLTAPREGVWALAVEGSFDDCQRAAKEVLANGIDGADVLSANSINIGRLLPQMLFYLGRTAPEGRIREFVVPSGNLGNLTAGLLARSSSMPDARFLAATNANDYFARFLNDAAAVPASLKKTLSNAMDVANPSNLERITALYPRPDLADFLTASTADDRETRLTIRRVYEETGYVADPHTAVGLACAARSRARPDRPGERLYSVIATADPAKFPDTIMEETGVDLTRSRFSAEPSAADRVIQPQDIPEAVRWVAYNVH